MLFLWVREEKRKDKRNRKFKMISQSLGERNCLWLSWRETSETRIYAARKGCGFRAAKHTDSWVKRTSHRNDSG